MTLPAPVAGSLPGLDLDLPVCGRLFLRTVPGAVDYLFEDLRQLPSPPTVVRRYRNGILIDVNGPLRPLAGIRYFDVCGLPLGDDPAADLAQSLSAGVLSALGGPDAALRFRVAEIGEGRWPLRDTLESRLGWLNRPDDWDLNLDTWDGGLLAQLGPLYLTRRFGELARMPASTNPVIAAVMVRLAKLAPGDVVLDPFCGAGTVLVLAGDTTPGVHLTGGEINPRWQAMARHNLSVRGLPGQILHSDARRIPLADGSVDRVVSNLPFGKRIGSHTENTQLYPAVLREIARVMHKTSRAVLLTDDKRLFKESVQRTPLIRVVKEIMLEQHGGLHPTAYVLTKRGNSRKR
jgi:tRNA (guanine6-N2)-methyltransferase